MTKVVAKGNTYALVEENGAVCVFHDDRLVARRGHQVENMYKDFINEVNGWYAIKKLGLESLWGC